MNLKTNQSNNKKLQLIERIISIENNEVIENSKAIQNLI